ncbi:hypothetical protein [Niameybacter massiliensis]|uniref:hypothetical protein n=1 Tax=Niameybacter massiliensis TaxID=1658108 RepID=UPI0006B5993D|nr:hypothetical protein [Niameybacter massiliensis]
MDISTVESLIASLGVPIFVMVACGFFVWKLWQQQVADKDKLYVELAESRMVNQKAIETIAIYASKLDDIQDDVKEIKQKVGA